MGAQDAWQSTKISSGTTVLAAHGGATLKGIFVSSVSGTPSITVYDAASATGTPVVGKFAPAALGKYDFDGLGCGTGLTILVSASCVATVLWRPPYA